MIAWDLWIIDDIVMAPYRFIAGQIDDKVSDLIGDFFNWIAGLLLAGVLWLFDVLWEFMNKSTSPDLGAAWYANGPYQICLYLGVTLLVMTVLMAVADALWHRDGSALLRTVVEGLPKAMFVLTGLLTLTTWGVQLGDAITTWLMDSYGAGMRAFPDNIRAALGDMDFGMGLLVVALLALVMLLVLLIVLGQLVVRQGYIYLATALTATVVGLELYRPTRGATGRSIRLLVGLIAAKPAIALCFAIAGASMGGNDYVPAEEPVAEATAEPAAGDCPSADPVAATAACGDPAGGGFIDAATSTPIEEESSAELAPTVGAMLAGTALMLLAAFAPSMILKFFTAADATVGAGGASALANMARTGATIGVAAATGGASAAAGAAAGSAGKGGGSVPLNHGTSAAGGDDGGGSAVLKAAG
jgi:hypothetical protein